MPGGVAGERSDTLAAPMPIALFRRRLLHTSKRSLRENCKPDERVRPGALALYSSPTFLVSFAFIEPKPLLMLLPIDFTPSTVFSDVVLTTSFVF